MPDLSFAEVGEILQLLQRVEGADVTLEWGDLKVHVRRGVAAGSVPGATGAAGASETADAAARTSAPSSAAGPLTADPVAAGTDSTDTAPAPASSHPSAPATASAPAETPAHWVAVKAPMVGTFYRAPKPDDPPFAEVGDLIAEGDVVGLIEVMKLFTELTSEVGGKVARVAADNATLVEYGQPLLWIEPS